MRPSSPMPIRSVTNADKVSAATPKAGAAAQAATAGPSVRRDQPNPITANRPRMLKVAPTRPMDDEARISSGPGGSDRGSGTDDRTPPGHACNDPEGSSGASVDRTKTAVPGRRSGGEPSRTRT